jgi:hypothetical protein
VNYSVKIEKLHVKEFLILRGFVELGGEADPFEASMRLISGRIADGSADSLRQAACSVPVYMLFGNAWKKGEDAQKWLCSYDMACENFSGAAKNGVFGAVRLEAGEYALFDCAFEREGTMAEAYAQVNELYWGGWLRENPYISAIDPQYGAEPSGTSAIELYLPLNPAAEVFSVKIWFPIRKIK